MAVTKTIKIDGKPVTFKASAAIPRLYRNKFQRDIYKDLQLLQAGIENDNAESSSLDVFSLEMFENIGWLMAWYNDPKQVPDTPEAWLDEFGVFSIYEILPQLLDLWNLNMKRDVVTRKNSRTPKEK